MADSLQGRIARLESQNRRFKRAAGAALAVTAGALLMGQAAPEKIPDVIKAHSVAVVDETGAVRALLAAGAKGTGLILSDPDGKPRALLTVAANGAGLNLADAAGRTRLLATVGAQADGAPSINLLDKDGKPAWKAP